MTTTMKILKGKEMLSESNKGRLNVIYALPKSGKTRFCLTAARTKKTLYIDSELSSGIIAPQIPDWKEIEKNIARPQFIGDDGRERPITLEELKQIIVDPKILEDYELIVIDSLTHIVRNHTEYLKDLKGGKALSFAEWGDLGNTFDRFLSFCQRNQISVIIAVHEEEKNNENVLVHRPSTQGSMVINSLVQRADNIFYMNRDEEGNYYLHTHPSNTWVAATRDQFPASFKNDDISYENLEKHFTRTIGEPVKEKKAVVKPKPAVATPPVATPENVEPAPVKVETPPAPVQTEPAPVPAKEEPVEPPKKTDQEKLDEIREEQISKETEAKVEEPATQPEDENGWKGEKTEVDLTEKFTEAGIADPTKILAQFGADSIENLTVQNKKKLLDFLNTRINYLKS